MNIEDPTLPADIERQLQSLEVRHARHQRLMDEQHDRKAIDRENHRKRKHARVQIPILLL